MIKWNSVSEGLPKCHESVLVTDGNDYFIAILLDSKIENVFYCHEEDSNIYEITHWTYINLPE